MLPRRDGPLSQAARAFRNGAPWSYIFLTCLAAFWMLRGTPAFVAPTSHGGPATAADWLPKPSEAWPLPFVPGPIPMQLWQTFPTKKALPKEAKAYRQSWVKQGRDLGYGFHDDAQADTFMARYFSPEIVAMYRGFPLGVMRADFWRYAILYVHGGIYADVDVECKQPVKAWFSGAPKDMLKACPDCSWNTCSMLVSQERKDGVFMAQWNFAGVRGHPVLYTVMKNIMERAKGGVDLTTDKAETSVHYYTGPAIWTDAVAEALQMKITVNVNASAMFETLLADTVYQVRAKEMGLCLVQGDFFFGFNAHNTAASLFWKHVKDYPNWRDQLGKLQT